jgi:hypothetical protein
MKRILLFALVLAMGSVFVGPLPARAGGLWDPNEPGHRLDIRWVGVYEQTGGRIRVTLTFYDKVRPLKWFGGRDAPRAALSVGFTDDPRLPPNFTVSFFLNAHLRLRARECESGSACTDPVRVSRPNAITLRTWIGFPDRRGPRSGWPFRATSQFANTASLVTIDRTAWGTVT